MKFDIGDKVWIEWAGDVEQYEILQVFDKTNRYRAIQLTGDFKLTLMFNAEEVYATRKEHFEDELKRIDKEILELGQEREECLREIKSSAETK